MAYKPCDFDRESYLELDEEIGSEDKSGVFFPDTELCEFNEDAEALACELAYTRCRVAKLEQFIRNGVELGYIAVPDEPDPARQTINELLKISIA